MFISDHKIHIKDKEKAKTKYRIQKYKQYKNKYRMCTDYCAENHAHRFRHCEDVVKHKVAWFLGHHVHPGYTNSFTKRIVSGDREFFRR